MWYLEFSKFDNVVYFCYSGCYYWVYLYWLFYFLLIIFIVFLNICSVLVGW